MGNGAVGDELDGRFAALVEEMVGRPGVSVGGGRGFGSGTLQVNGRIFAMARRGGLVVKLPAPRVAELIRSGAAGSFDAGKGRPMREWAVLPPSAGDDWAALALEALDFVRNGRPA